MWMFAVLLYSNLLYCTPPRHEFVVSLRLHTRTSYEYCTTVAETVTTPGKWLLEAAAAQVQYCTYCTCTRGGQAASTGPCSTFFGLRELPSAAPVPVTVQHCTVQYPATVQYCSACMMHRPCCTYTT
ncbi:hypothetical protein BCV70DRAFT_18604 [Testicularia cyperi]|uniref:Secreted protein n=1 Tax=Testicularia cyperi TaxID=1882483 RepID=A0A317XZ07_9BASI|nr:hypothetical protein BCV70DRAFT_18604 [Testicularia cyperi]